MPLGVGGDHSVADRGQSDLGPFALGIEGVLHFLALRQLLPGPQERQEDEHAGGGQVGHQQQPEQGPRALAEGVAEGLAAGVTFSLIAWISVFHCCTCSALACPAPMPARILPATSIQFHDVLVAHQPQLDGALEVTEVVEVAVQPDDRGNVVGMVAALEDALAGRLDVRVGLVRARRISRSPRGIAMAS